MAIDLGELATAIGQLILRFRVRRRTKDDWTTVNEVLLDAEFGWERDTNRLKIGDGLQPWGSLPYFGEVTLDSSNAGTGIHIEMVQDTTGGTGGDFATDTSFSSVAVLTHFDSLSSGNAVDSGPMGSLISPIGAIALSTVQSKFGGSSSYSDQAPQAGWAVGDNVNFNFGAGDFTIEGWFYASGNRSSGGILMLFSKMNGATGFATGLRLSDDGGGSIVCYIPCTDSTVIVNTWTASFAATHSPGPNAWTHVALTRQGTDIHLYINGTLATAGTVAAIGTKTVTHDTDPFYVGMSAQGGMTTASWRGYIDEVRVTHGVARYTGTFTPAIVQLPGYSTPVTNIGTPYPVISNIGVLSVVAGTGISVDSTDPQNPIITNAGTSGGGANTTPDSHPASPTIWDDEFEYGTAVDTTGARRTSAQAWALHLSGSAAAPAVANGALQVAYGSGKTMIMLQSAPVGDCGFEVKVRRNLRSANPAFAILFYNSANTKGAFWYVYSPSPTVAVTQGTFDATTWVFTSSSNAFTGTPNPTTDQDFPVYLRARIVGGSIFYDYSLSGYDNDWQSLFNQTIASYLGAVTHVGLYSFSTGASCDFFRRIN